MSLPFQSFLSRQKKISLFSRTNYGSEQVAGLLCRCKLGLKLLSVCLFADVVVSSQKRTCRSRQEGVSPFNWPEWRSAQLRLGERHVFAAVQQDLHFPGERHRGQKEPLQTPGLTREAEDHRQRLRLRKLCDQLPFPVQVLQGGRLSCHAFQREQQKVRLCLLWIIHQNPRRHASWLSSSFHVCLQRIK